MMIVAIFVSAGGAIARKNFLHTIARSEHFEADSISGTGFGADGTTVIDGCRDDPPTRLA